VNSYLSVLFLFFPKISKAIKAGPSNHNIPVSGTDLTIASASEGMHITHSSAQNQVHILVVFFFKFQSPTQFAIQFVHYNLCQQFMYQ
jgi:hypothetical protein